MSIKTQGLTLLELLITLSLLALLSTGIYSSWQQKLIQSRRQEAMLALYDLAARIESHYAKSLSYKLPKSLIPKLHWYKFSILSKEDYYLIKAIPKNIQINDLSCQTLTLDIHGQPGIAPGPKGNPYGNLSDCWQFIQN